ncbi:probable disease resistance protein At5g66900 isoform X2 [Lotus japonicus]|nr:probable disease resistance protein At5g66900 isoform X2 [Lotus japonicus]XP_057441219.1 probable disease resistance protein At5g66900 isoform X2 [Lotus japonicus]
MAMIADAVVGELVSQLLSKVLEMKDRAKNFKPTLLKLENTLKLLQPDADEIEAEYAKLDRASETEGLKKLMKNGTKLVQDCSKKFPWLKRFWTKAKYQKELDELHKSIETYYSLKIQGQTLATVLRVENKVDRLGLPSNDRIEFRAVCTPLDPPSFTVGLDKPLDVLKGILLSKKANVTVTVHTITGLSGVGKTTLARKFCSDKEVKDEFKENIFFLTLGKISNLNTIVEKLFKHNNYKATEVESDEDLVNQLAIFFKQIRQIKGPILLVLDNIIPGSESLVDNFVFEIPDYKILVTSRSAKTRFGSRQLLKPLDSDFDMDLFCHSASLDQLSSKIAHDDVKKIVRSCRGSPSALIVTASSLRGQEDPLVWNNRANALSNGHQPKLDSNNDVLNCLHKSLDVLNPKAMECFKDLGLFPENQKIPVAALVDMWAELHTGNDASALENIYQLVHMNLADIIVTRKLDIVDYNYRYVTQYGLLRDLAIYQTIHEAEDKGSRLIIEKNGNNLLRWWGVEIATRILSISTDEAFPSEWCNNLQTTEVEALVLNLRGKKCTLPMFMKNMNKLKVLILSNYDFPPVELENFELLEHLPSLKRLRLDNVSIPLLIKAEVQLKNLRKCSFFMCNVNETFKNSNTQVSDMLPNLVEMDFDYCTMVELPVVVSNSVSLTKLRITNCYMLTKLPEEIGKLVNLETLSLSSCIDLVELPQSITSLEKLTFLDISDCISFTKLPEDIGKLRNLQKLNMRGCSRLSELPSSIMDIEALKDVVCDEEVAELWEDFRMVREDIRLQVIKTDFSLDFLHLR